MVKNNRVEASNVPLWDFGFRYDLQVMDLVEVEVLMIKYELELKRNAWSPVRFRSINEILGKIYREIMQRKLVNKINEIAEQQCI
jgi:hypothetical protein